MISSVIHRAITEKKIT